MKISTREIGLILLIAVVLIAVVFLMTQKPAVAPTPVGPNGAGNTTPVVIPGQDPNNGGAPLGKSDTELYDKAIHDLDLSLCDQITNAEIKAACKSVVQSGIDFRNSV